MKKYLILLFVAAAAVFQSCDNNDDLWDAIDDLKSRVQALETQVNALNDNVKALQTLYSGATVSEVKNEDGKCTITLTDGKKLTLVSDIDALVPVVSINEETGMWQYSIGGGEPQSLNVKAVAEDGKTPTFQVTDDGYWQVDLGDGQGWRDVTYADGGKVSAITDTPTEDKFFQTVEVVGDSLHIVMQNGDELDIPIVKGFLCQIVDGEGNVITDVQSFDMGVTKEFTVNMRGVDNTILTAPEGWTASLSEPVSGTDDMKTATLSVTSPAPTRATASTAKDVSILATSGKYSCIAKIQVESTGIDPNAPRITVAVSTDVAATYSTLTFDVVLTNATTWKYICKPLSEQAPTADEIMASGTDGSGTSVTVSGLEGETDYTIYVVAYDGAAVSDVASAQNRTLVAPVDYYTKGVDINGTNYSSSSTGATAVEESKDFTGSDFGSEAVYFLGDQDNTLSYTAQGTVTSNQAFIGRYSDSKPTLTLNGNITLNNQSATVAFKNLNIAFDARFIQATANTGGAGSLIFEDCEISYTGSYLATFTNAGSAVIGNIIFRNCKICYEGTPSGTTTTINIITTDNAAFTGATDLESVLFDNNVIYTEKVASFIVFNGQKAPAFTNLDISFTNNTLVNFMPNGGQGAVLLVSNCKSVSALTENLYVIDSRTINTFGFKAMSTTPAVSYPTIFDNMVYRTGEKGNTTAIYGNNSSAMTKATVYPFSSENFATGTFIKTAEAAAYGSSLDNE
ncbi:MAG TPA: DUF4988 domain-containing protein [Candidatus Alistipes cottocaccae]|nr:DUF4988 domain-containing protein [Candidatus Alistipes cottocaccae]